MVSLKKFIINFLFGKEVKFQTYDNFNEAKNVANDYEENNFLVDLIIDKTKKFKHLLNHNEPIDYINIRTFFPFILFENNENLQVLDFGGAAGAHYFLYKYYFGQSQKIQWHVVETNIMVEKAKLCDLENDELKFFSSIEEIEKKYINNYDLIYANASIQYTDNPYSTLKKLFNLNPKNIFITRTPFDLKVRNDIIGIRKSNLNSNGIGQFEGEYEKKNFDINYPFTIINKHKFEELLIKHNRTFY